jgi:hypothetical protein
MYVFLVLSPSGFPITTHYAFFFKSSHQHCSSDRFIPFRSSHLEKFLQPGREGILNPHRATKRAVLLKKLVKQGHKVKPISETVSLYILSPRVLSLVF